MTDQDFRSAISNGANDLQAKASKAKAAIEDVADKVSAGVSKAGDQASDTVAKLSDGAVDAYDRVYTSARQISDVVDPFVQERPYAALGIAAALGVFVGLLLTARGPKVVYVRPPAR
jgi:ElaB/YqjD/DUF883 family membrane-anchored ribosome-binding protein